MNEVNETLSVPLPISFNMIPITFIKVPPNAHMHWNKVNTQDYLKETYSFTTTELIIWKAPTPNPVTAKKNT